MDLVKTVVYHLGSTRNSISVRWESVSCTRPGGDTSVAYVVQVEDDSNDWTTKYWGLKNSAVLKGLGPEKLYNVRVGACEYLGDDAWSDEVWSDLIDEIAGLLWTFYLFQYVEKGDAAKIKRFLEERNDCLDTYNRYGETPLLVALRRKNDSVLRVLLEAGADVYQLAKSTCKTPLMAACYNGYRAAVEALCSIGVDWSVADRNGCQAIHYAVDGGQLDIVNLAIERGADVNARDKFGWTPIMRAVLIGAQENLIKLLLDKGADTTLTDVNKMTALGLAELMKDDKLIEILSLHSTAVASVGDEETTVEDADDEATGIGEEKDEQEVIPAEKRTLEQTEESDAVGDLNEGVDENDDDNNAVKALVEELAQIAMADVKKS